MNVQFSRAALSRSRIPIHTSFNSRRTLFEWIRRKQPTSEKLPPAPFDPQSAEFQRKRAAKQMENQREQEPRQKGDLAASSIFDDPADKGSEDDAGLQLTDEERISQRAKRLQLDPYLSAPATDPRPAARRRWLRRQVAMSVRNRGAISKDIVRKRQEREHLTRSEWLPTSMKKLMPLARQIQGQSVEEALVQLRFSKKAVAKDVMRILQTAKQEAIAARGMGLGFRHDGTIDEIPATAADADATTGAVATEVDESSTEARVQEPSVDESPKQAKAPIFEAQTIVDKKGKRRTIADPTNIYIAQAWIGRGPYGKMPEYRARGRMNILRPPHTSISLLLKEEKTRLREASERDEKQRRRKPWMHHPDRPITQQRQYLMW